MGLKIIDYPCTQNRCYQQNVKIKPIGIQIHSIGCAQGTARSVADYWNSPNVSALVNYICDSDTPGKVLRVLPEGVFSWADAGYGNRNLITIELCESDWMKYTSGASYDITNKLRFLSDIQRSYDTAVLLCADICKRYGWDPMSKLPSGLYLISSHNEGRLAGLSSAHVDPSHLWPRITKTMDDFRYAVVEALNGVGYSEVPETVWFRVRKSWTDVDSQIGAYMSQENAVNNCPAGYSVYDNEGTKLYTNTEVQSGTQAIDFADLKETVAASKMLELVRSCDNSGILYSVTTAQMILESGYVKTSLAKAANNCFGMKTSLSGNTWPGSTWDGVSTVASPTWEVYDGEPVKITAEFRKYKCIEDSVKDHAAYLLGAMNGSKKRYAGLTEAKDYHEAIRIIKNGGYATDTNYVSKIESIIQRFGLDKYDGDKPETDQKEPVVKKRVYRVQVGLYDNEYLAKAWAVSVKEVSGFDAFVVKVGDQYQVICGSYSILDNAKDRVKTLIDIHGIGAIIKEAFVEES